MIKLITIQTTNKLNSVIAVDEEGNGNAHHEYLIQYDQYPVGEPIETIPLVGITFQNGVRSYHRSTHGVTNEDLLEICRHRLQCFQTSEYKCRENMMALFHIEEALMWLNHRVTDRAARNVLGVNSK